MEAVTSRPSLLMEVSQAATVAHVHVHDRSFAGTREQPAVRTSEEMKTGRGVLGATRNPRPVLWRQRLASTAIELQQDVAQRAILNQRLRLDDLIEREGRTDPRAQLALGHEVENGLGMGLHLVWKPTP